jgi:uncharacterized protein YndB with AHSA1/START domain
MYTSTGLKELIQISDTYAEIEMPFYGTAVNGMLLWLDETLIKQWWKATDAKIDPQPGGMFYMTWANTRSNKNQTVYGVIDDINTENNSFKITKVIYITDEDKMTGMELNISFSKEVGKRSVIKLRLSHNFDPYMKHSFDKVVGVAWPRMFGMFKEFIEN